MPSCKSCPLLNYEQVLGTRYPVCTGKDTPEPPMVQESLETPEWCPQRSLMTAILHTSKVIGRTLAGCTVIIAITAIMFGIYYFGRKTMHNDLTEDMKRNQDAAIPCINPNGLFYLYTYDTTYQEWEHNHIRKSTP